ncbi:FAD-dependent oxidoreductase [Cerasibacillus sp. JNUCC 74]
MNENLIKELVYLFNFAMLVLIHSLMKFCMSCSGNVENAILRFLTVRTESNFAFSTIHILIALRVFPSVPTNLVVTRTIYMSKMETPIEDLYVAGNITGIEGAKVAISQGVVAGYSMAIRSGKQGLADKLQDALNTVHDTRRQAAIQFHPKIELGRDIIQKQWEKYQSRLVQI